MPQIATSRMRSADTRRNSRQSIAPAALLQQRTGNGADRGASYGSGLRAEIGNPVVTGRVRGPVEHLGGHVGDPPA